MRQVTYHNLQYARERELYTKLRPVLEDLRRKYKAFSDKTQQHEKEFFKHLNHSVKIDRLPRMSQLLHQLKDRLKTDAKIDLFLFQSPTSKALCIPRYGFRGRADSSQVVILVSQHFLNELTSVEQLSVLGHELAHLLYGHVHIPARAILESQFSLTDVQGLKSDVLKWLTCAEVSCDMIGYLSCGCNTEAFSLAMLKYTTGLTSSTIHADNQHRNLIELMFEQFEEISKASFDTILTTHPLTPLRLKIVKAVSDSPLLKHFGESVAEQTLTGYESDFNALIDTEIRKIYPRICPQRPVRADDILFELCIAVALADGSISKGEVSAISKILGSDADVEATYIRITNKIASSSPASFTNDIVQKAVREMKRQNYRKANIVGILRPLLEVAASDGKTEPCELDTIYSFAKEFGVSKQEILFLLERRGLR